MIAHLENLSRLPGVEFVLLVSHDGVPIAQAGDSGDASRQESLAALTASWLNDLRQAVAPLGWHSPERISLRAARGTLVLKRSESACLVVLLGRESRPEDVRLSMDGALARIERARTSRSSQAAERVAAIDDVRGALPEPDAAIPYRHGSAPVEEGVQPGPHPGQSPGN